MDHSPPELTSQLSFRARTKSAIFSYLIKPQTRRQHGKETLTYCFTVLVRPAFFPAPAGSNGPVLPYGRDLELEIISTLRFSDYFPIPPFTLQYHCYLFLSSSSAYRPFLNLQRLIFRLVFRIPPHNNAYLHMSTPIQHGSSQKRIAGMAANVSANPSPRRVLGDVTNSVRNSPRNPHDVANETGKAIPIGSPLKQSQTMTPATILSTKENRGQLASASLKKRPFEDMDDAEDHADADRRSARRIVMMSPSRHLTTIARPPVRSVSFVILNTLLRVLDYNHHAASR
jgi:hypothetical protein